MHIVRGWSNIKLMIIPKKSNFPFSSLKTPLLADIVVAIVGMFGHGDSVKHSLHHHNEMFSQTPCVGSKPPDSSSQSSSSSSLSSSLSTYSSSLSSSVLLCPVPSLDTQYEVQARRPLTLLFSISV